MWCGVACCGVFWCDRIDTIRCDATYGSIVPIGDTLQLGTMQRYVTLCHVTLRHATLRYAMLFDVIVSMRRNVTCVM